MELAAPLFTRYSITVSDYLRDVLGAGNPYSAQPLGLVADSGPDIPGGEGANKGFWRRQLKDRLMRFAKMYGNVLFDVEIENIGRVSGHGQIIDAVASNIALIRIKNHPILGDMDLPIPSTQFEVVDAIIPDADYERISGNDVTPNNEPTPELKDSITGDEALQKIYGQMGLHAKKSGRFAVGRSVKDVRAAAKETYKPVYEKLKVEYPELVSEFPDYESYWDYASSSLAAGVFTRWADSVDEIPELTKASNKIYAREILGLKEDGMIEFYRNSINHKSSEELAGAGYASLDRRMAWDYNSYLIKYEDNGLTENDGRYTVRAKPDEVTGLLGISGAEDEYGVVVGLDVTSQPGRVTRVGDLEMQQVAPWSNDIQTFDRSGGGSPFRRVSPASQFEVFATETPVPGENYSDFYEAFNLDKESRPIPTKWDEMFGEGSFDALNGDYPGYRSIQRLFIDAGDGKVGLDMMELDQISSRDSQDPQANDTYDKTLKMLSVIQELSGKTFMVHRGHNPDDPRLDEVKDEEPAVNVIDFSNFEKVSGQLGSNPGGVYRDPETGNQYYVKIQDKDRGNNEALASAIYKEADLGTLEVKDGILDGEPITYTEWKEGLTPLFGPKANDLGYSKRQEALDAAKEGYLIDAWIANWDIVGEGLDNISTDKDSNPIRLDSGGALLYRARGSRKGGAFGDEVVELETFKDSSNTAELMYGSMYLFPKAERDSYEKLKAISPERIDQLVDQYISNPDDNKELKDKLKARRQFILDKYENSYLLTGSESKLYGSKTTQNISKEDKKAVNNYTNAGHRYINKYLRDPENPEYQKSKESAEKLNNIIKDNTLIEDTTLLRVAGNFDEDYQPGDIIEDAGIQSTTKVGRSAIHSTVMDKLYPGDPEAAEFLGYTTYTIKAPAGTPALDVTDMSQFRSEGEVLLPAGTKFKVLSYERKPVSEFGGSYRNITVEVVTDQEVEELSKPNVEQPVDSAPEKPVPTSAVLDRLIKDGVVYLDSIPDSTIVSDLSVDDIPEDQRRALSTYSGSDYQVINNLLRFGPESAYTPTKSINKVVKNLDDLIESKGTVESDSVVFRGMIETERYEDSDILMSEMLDDLKPGDVISDPAFLSTSSDKNVALRKFGPGNMTDEDSELDASNPVYQSSSFWVIKVPGGSKAFATPEKGFGYASIEKEVLLPRNTQLRIDGIKKVAQEEEGGENGEFNYYVEATVQPQAVLDRDPITGLDTNGDVKEKEDKSKLVEPGEMAKELPDSSWGADFSKSWPDSEIELVEKNGKKLPRGWNYRPNQEAEKDGAESVPSTIADKYFTNEKAANELARMYYENLASKNELEFYQNDSGLIVTFEGPEGANLSQEKKNRFLQDVNELYGANKDIVDGELMIRYSPEIAVKKGGTVAWAGDKTRNIDNLFGKYPASVGRSNPKNLGESSKVKMIATETLEKTTLAHEFGHILRYSNVKEEYVEKTTKRKRKRGYQVSYEDVIGWALDTKSISGTRGDSLIAAQKRRPRIHMTEYSKKTADEWYAELFNSWILGGGSFNYREDLSESDIIWLNNFAKDQEWKMPK